MKATARAVCAVFLNAKRKRIKTPLNDNSSKHAARKTTTKRKMNNNEPFNLGLLELCLHVALSLENWVEAAKYQARITNLVNELNAKH
jgi:hypothetical protein